MVESPRRRWFTFSLRTLFVLVTVMAVSLGWLGLQLKWIRDRHEAPEKYQAFYFNTNRAAPWSIRIFGEQGIKNIYVHKNIDVQYPGDSASDDARVRKLQLLFPEAEVELVDLHGEEIGILAALDRPTDIDFGDVPLQDAIDYLKDYHMIEIQFDIKALEKLGIVPWKTEVTCTLNGISLRSALNQMLSRVESSLTFMIKDEVLLITTEQQKKLNALRHEQRRAAQAARTPAERLILAALDSPTSLNFEDTPLQDAIDYLKDYHGIEIQFDIKSLETLGITPEETALNATLKGISLRSALNLLLARIDDSLTFTIEDNVLLITTRTVASNGTANLTSSNHP